MSTATARDKPVKKRGREGALDMVRSLGLCLLVVVPIWFLAQPPDEAEQRLRVVEQADEVDAWRASSSGPAPALGALPQDWLATVVDLSPDGLRLGWNTGAGRYVEFAGSAGSAEPFVAELTGAQQAEGSVDVDGTAWQRYVDDDGSQSLVRTDDDVTVVVGTRRSTASADELRALARSVQR